jgi:hypothetical protein
LWPPDGVQPVTQPVLFKKKGESLVLMSETKGASIAYQANEKIGQAHWDLYTTPLEKSKIDSIVSVGIRIGFKQSDVSRYITGN